MALITVITSLITVDSLGDVLTYNSVAASCSDAVTSAGVGVAVVTVITGFIAFFILP
mgnify:CR=1 FL=1